MSTVAILDSSIWTTSTTEMNPNESSTDPGSSEVSEDGYDVDDIEYYNAAKLEEEELNNMKTMDIQPRRIVVSLFAALVAAALFWIVYAGKTPTTSLVVVVR